MSRRIHTVLDTRPATAPAFTAILRAAGISVLHIPLIRIEDVGMHDDARAALAALPRYDGVLLTSMNGVRGFAALLRAASIAPERLPPVFVVGPKTAALARREGFSVQALPSSSYGATMASELPDVADRRFLHACGNLAREETGDGIRARGGTVEALVVYRTLGPSDADAVRLRDAADTGAYDCVAFFSPSTVRQYTDLLGTTERPASIIAVIGDTTAAEANTRGLHVDIIPPTQTAEALADAVVAWEMLGPAPRRGAAS